MSFGNFRLVLLMCVLATCLARSISEEGVCGKDIIIILDESTSIDKEEYEHMKYTIAKLVGLFNVVEGLVRFSVVGFATDVKKENVINFGDYIDVSELKQKIMNMKQQKGGAYLGRAIKYVNDKVMPYTRTHSSVVVWILTNGENAKDKEEQLKLEKERLDDKVTIEILCISNGDKTPKKCFDERLKKYNGEMVGVESAEKFRDDVIQNVNESFCRLKKHNQYPERRVVPCYATKDIIVALESSSSVNNDEWAKMTKFLSDVVKNFRVAQNVVRFDVFAFNEDVIENTEIGFTDYRGMRDLSNRIINMEKSKGAGARLGAALRYINNVVLPKTRTSSKGQKVKVEVWVISDGNDQDLELLQKQSKIIRNKVKIDVLNITNEEDPPNNFVRNGLVPYVDSIDMIKNVDIGSTAELLPEITEELCE